MRLAQHNLPVPITLHAPEFIFQSLENISKATNTISVDNSDRVGFIDVVFPIYNSENAAPYTNWVFEPTELRTNGWNFVVQGPSTIFYSGSSALKLSLAVDASLAESNTVSFGDDRSVRTNTVAQTNLTARIRPQLK